MQASPQNSPSEKRSLTVTGMACSGCADSVKKVLSRVPGVSSAEVDLDAGRAVVTGTANPQELLAAVRAAGYDAQLA